MSSKYDGNLEISLVETARRASFILAIEAQSKAIRDDRRREDDEARGTRFGQETLDTELYEEKPSSDYHNYIPGTNDEDVSALFSNCSAMGSLSCFLGRR